MKKTLLPLAMILMLPLTANAEYTYQNVDGPANVPLDGTVIRAAAFAPYQTVTIENDDNEHIASVKYVKGAYNETIAAMNKIEGMKQDKLFYVDPDNGDEVSMGAWVSTSIDEGDLNLITVSGVADAINDVNNTIFAQRAIVYTTWGDDRDSATQQVPFVTASGQ